jgi:hypothetical protein
LSYKELVSISDTRERPLKLLEGTIGERERKTRQMQVSKSKKFVAEITTLNNAGILQPFAMSVVEAEKTRSPRIPWRQIIGERTMC